ncbi:MAG: hypothetical protein ACKO96_15240 [Flammeovirgaceae bacterium]
MNMEHGYTDKLVTAWGGMKEMKILIDQTGISKKLAELGYYAHGIYPVVTLALRQKWMQLLLLPVLPLRFQQYGNNISAGVMPKTGSRS